MHFLTFSTLTNKHTQENTVKYKPLNIIYGSLVPKYVAADTP